MQFTTSFGPARVVNSSREIDPAIWKNAFADCAKDHRYYEITEQTLGAQFEHRYLVLENARSRKTAVQPLFFVDQNLAEGVPLPLRKIITWPRRFFPRWLKTRMLCAGCCAGHGALDHAESWAVRALHEALDFYAPEAGASIVLLKDFPAEYRGALTPLSRNGYRRVPSMPGCRLELDFANFDELSRKKIGRAFRENLRRKFKKLAQHSLTMEVVADGSPFADTIYALYLQTFERSQFHFEKLTREFFIRIGREMSDRARFFLWRLDEKIVAFALCLEHGDTLHDLNLGLDYSVALDLHIYFATRRDILQWAMERGLRRYEVGPLNYHPKLHFGMKLAPLDLYARHTSPLFNPLFKRALAFLQPARHDPILRQFPNANEL